MDDETKPINARKLFVSKDLKNKMFEPPPFAGVTLIIKKQKIFNPNIQLL
jgi:hypothetical protein